MNKRVEYCRRKLKSNNLIILITDLLEGIKIKYQKISKAY